MAPLLQPADCSVLVVDPRRQHLRYLGDVEQRRITERVGLLANAMRIGAIPCRLVFARSTPDAADWLIDLDLICRPEVHVMGSPGPSWSRSGVAAALAAQDRSSLILCGFWLETTVTFLALPALASGFDVFIATDVAPARSEATRLKAGPPLRCGPARSKLRSGASGSRPPQFAHAGGGLASAG